MNPTFWPDEQFAHIEKETGMSTVDIPASGRVGRGT
jgi:hypothetical protein